MLDKRKNQNTGKMEYCLVSRKDPSKILEWYGSKKPSAATIQHSERRVQYFKHFK